MGFDLFGSRGNYFQCTGLQWSPLWNFVCWTCGEEVLTDEDERMGEGNDGHHIDADKCQKIVEKLTSLLDSGEVKAYEESSKAHFKRLGGPSYPFEEENIRRFVVFVKDSNGFNIDWEMSREFRGGRPN
jgi:hypothetical protein